MRVEGDKLIVRQRVSRVVAVPPQNVPGQAVVAWQRKSDVRAYQADPADVSVFDVKGNRLQTKAWKEKLKNDVHVLVASDGKVPHPRELALYKEDALLIVLPAPAAHPGYGATTTTETPFAPPANRTAPSLAPPAPGGVRPSTAAPAPAGTPGPVTPPATIPPPGGTDLPPEPVPTNPVG